VVNASGEWVGPAPTVNWADLEGIPEDFADGVDDDTDTDTDSFAALGTSCFDGDVPVWDSVLVEWVCDMDQDTLASIDCVDGQLISWSGDAVGWMCADDADTMLTEDDVDAMVSDNGYAMMSEVFSGSFLDLVDVAPGLADGDDDTQLTADEVDAIVADNGYAMATDVFSGSFTALSDVPEGLGDGDDNTQLTADEVDAIVADNGYAMFSETFSGSFIDLEDVPFGLEDGDDDTTRTDDEIVTTVTSGPIDLHPDTTIDGEQVASTSGSGTPAGLIAMWSGATPPTGWTLCDGTSGTPDLRNRFIVASGDVYTSGDSGSASVGLSVGMGTGYPWHGSGGRSFVNSVSVGDVTPPYYALAYIMKE